MSISMQSQQDSIREKRLKDCREVKIEFISNAAFERALSESDLAAYFLGPMPKSNRRASSEKDAPRALQPYLAGLHLVPLLTRKQEVHLFRKMNFLKFLADNRRAQEADLCNETLDEIERLLAQALQIKNQLITANLRLVVSIAKKLAWGSEHFWELVSDGNMKLMRAIVKFDFARGYKFSTYATLAIQRELLRRSIRKEATHQRRFTTGMLEAKPFQNLPDRSQECSREVEQNEAIAQAKLLLKSLTPREQRIIKGRLGLDDLTPQTLEQLGRTFSISKERVRQIEVKANEKLRRMASSGLPHNPADSSSQAECGIPTRETAMK
jgi:RNA polymerase primary sigma factor